MVAILVAATFAFPPQYESDDRLRAPVSIESPIITIGDALRRISEATGVKLTPSNDLARRKATLFVKSRPSAELLASMADTFSLTFTESKGGYAVALTREASSDEAESARRDTLALHTDLDRYFTALADKSSLTRNQVALEQSKFSKDLANLGTDSSPDTKTKRDAINFQLFLLRNADWSGVARVFLDQQPSTNEALEAGSTLFGSTRSTDDCPHLGDDVKQYLEPSEEAIAVMRLNTASERFESHFITLGEQPGFMLGASFNLLDNDIEQYAEVRHCRAWAAKSDNTLKTVKPAAESARPPSVAQTLAEALTSLHQRSTPPIVADAFRVPCSIGWAAGGTVQEVLDHIATFSVARYPRGEVVFRSREGWIEGRHLQNWRLQGREIPESVIAPLETTVAKGKLPSVDQFSEFAASINQKQLDGFNDWQSPTVVRFPASAMNAVNSLRIWSLLSDAQKASARSQDGLLLATEDDSQVSRIVENLRAMLWTCQPTPKQLGFLLGDPAALKRTRLFLTISRGKTRNEPLGVADGSSVRPAKIDADIVMFTYGARQAVNLQDMYALPILDAAGLPTPSKP